MMSIVEKISEADCLGYSAAPQGDVMSDRVLINRIAEGDQGALRMLMLRHQSRVYRFAMRFIHDRSMAEDVVSDTFVAVWRQAPEFEHRSAVATWLLAIARYKALSARERIVAPSEPLDEFEATLVDPGQGPDAGIERQDSARLLRQCLAALPAEQAMLIDLVYFREKSVKEAAMIAGVSENTAKSRMFLGRKKLALLLNAAEVESASVTLVPSAETCDSADMRDEPDACIEEAAPSRPRV